MIDDIEIDTKQNEVKYGDILFTTSSETPNEVGMSSVWLENKRNIYLNSFCFGYRINITINYYYMAYYLRADVFRRNICLLAQGISRYNISKNKVMDINIFLPQNNEQTKIGNLLLTLDNLLTLHQRM
ncbi:EcoKI restriction-modification system protein HsdS [Anaerobiospirillum thomasii]|uniref:EcoKI restriction-modification system protein HsdS n=1 Tax=Anaerobiospirillum thomasii TaxID=179995 RepID=A0A2X0V6Z3_9GAMM|nr:EcoKI restriction-modification system protein HsdS [Anaerobiospirillum thomasii]